MSWGRLSLGALAPVRPDEACASDISVLGRNPTCSAPAWGSCGGPSAASPGAGLPVRHVGMPSSSEGNVPGEHLSSRTGVSGAKQDPVWALVSPPAQMQPCSERLGRGSGLGNMCRGFALLLPGVCPHPSGAGGSSEAELDLVETVATVGPGGSWVPAVVG